MNLLPDHIESIQQSRLTLVIPGMSHGGAERMLSHLANQWIEEGIAISLITLDTTDNDTYQLKPEVNRIGLDLLSQSTSLIHAVQNNWKRINVLRNAIIASEPDCVISFTDVMNTLTLMACKKLSVPVIISERADPSQQPISKVWKFLKQKYYPTADALVVQTDTIARYFSSLIKPELVHIIPNFVLPPAKVNRLENDEYSKTILAVGRLAPEKGFDLLIQAIEQLPDIYSDWQVVILGEGRLRNELQKQIDLAELSDRIQLLGWNNNPEKYFHSSKLFVLPSRHEGFPNALLEAMSYGMPVIAYDCESGPRHLIEHEHNGLLIENGNVNELALGIELLIGNAELRQSLGNSALKVSETHSVSTVMQKWNHLLKQILKI